MSVLTDLFMPWVATIPPITQPLVVCAVRRPDRRHRHGAGLSRAGHDGRHGRGGAAAQSAARACRLGTTILVVNSTVLILAVMVFGLEAGDVRADPHLCGARASSIWCRARADYGRTAIIISAQARPSNRAILTEMERGVTVLDRRAAATPNPVWRCCTAWWHAREISILKRLVQSIDPARLW